MKVVKFKFMLMVVAVSMVWSGFSYATSETQLRDSYVRISGVQEEIIDQVNRELDGLKRKARSRRLDKVDRTKAEVLVHEKEITVLEAENKIAEAKLAYLNRLQESVVTEFEDIDDDTKQVVDQIRIQTELKTEREAEIEELRSKIEASERFLEGVNGYVRQSRAHRENYRRQKRKNDELCKLLESLVDEKKKIETAYTKSDPVLRMLQYEEEPMIAMARATGFSVKKDMELAHKLFKEAEALQTQALAAAQFGNEELAEQLSEQYMKKVVQAQSIVMTVQMRAQGGGNVMSQRPMSPMQRPWGPSIWTERPVNQPRFSNPYSQGQFMFDGGMASGGFSGGGFPQMPMMGQGGLSFALPGGAFGGTSFNTGGMYTQDGAPGSFQMGWDSNPWQSNFNFGLSRPNKYLQDVYQNGIARGLGMPDPYGGYQTTEFGFLRPDQNLL